MAITTNLAGVARVSFEASGTREFGRDVSTMERQYRDATGGMSDGAIKLEIAQERLRRALAKGPAAAQSQRSALLAVRQAERELATQTRATTVVQERQARGFGRLKAGAASLAGAGGLGGLRSSVVGLAGGFLAGGGLVAAFGRGIEAASDLEEQVSRTRVQFGSSADSMLKWADRSVDALNLTKQAALAAASGFGGLFQTVGVGVRESAELSKQFVSLGNDLASYFNTTVPDALEAVRSGLVGEAEPLRRYNVLLSEARVQTEALRQTGKSSASALTDQEKVLARVALILKGTTAAQGDAARTAGSYANQTRHLNAELTTLQTNLGKGLVPALTPAVALLAQGAAAANEFATNIGKLKDAQAPSFEGEGSFLASLGEIPGARNLPFVGPFIDAAKRIQEAREEAERRSRVPDAAAAARAFKRATQPGLGGFIARARDQNTTTTPGRPPAFGEPGFKPLPARVVSTSLPRALSDALLRAQITPTPQDDLRRAKEAEAFWSGQLDLAKKGSEAHSTILAQLVAAHHAVEGLEQQLAGEQVRHDTVVDTTRRAATERHAKALERRKAFEKAAAEREQRTQAAIAKQARENADRINKALKDAKSGRELLQDQRSDDQRSKRNGPTPEETQFAQEIFKGVGAILERYYGNVVGPTGSNAMVEHLLREQTGVIRDAFGRPHVGYTRLIDEAAMQT